MPSRTQSKPELLDFEATTSTRSFLIRAESIEDANAKFMERMGYYPDTYQVNQIER